MNADPTRDAVTPAACERLMAGIRRRWGLDDAAAGLLFGRGSAEDAVPADADDTLERLRLVTEIDDLLGVLIADGDVAGWLHRHNPAFSASRHPLEAMSAGVHVLRGLRNVLAAHLGGLS